MNDLEAREGKASMIPRNYYDEQKDELFKKEQNAYASANKLRDTLLSLSLLATQKIIKEHDMEEASLEEVMALITKIGASVPLDQIKELTNLCDKAFKNMKRTYEKGFFPDTGSGGAGGLLSMFKD